MARFHRRKPRVVWLPPAAENRLETTNPAVSRNAAGAGQILLDSGATSLYGNVAGFSPLVSDISAVPFQSGGLPIESLADIQSSGYRLRRVVGKIWVDVGQNFPDPQSPPASQLLITVGIIVLKVDDNGQPLHAFDPDFYNPASIDNWSDPYLWRRSWKMSNIQAAEAAGQAIFPENNYECGSVMDGPHVDAKTARIVGPEERLYLVANTQVVGLGANATGAFSSRITWDLRFVASLRTNAGNRRNASR